MNRRCGLQRLVAITSLGLAVAWIGCSEEPPPPAAVARPVKILTLGDEGALRVLEYPGEIEAAQHADLGFEVPGQIIEFPVEEGQPVNKGQVLAKLDPRDYRSTLDAERAKRNQAKTEFDRQQKLFDADVASLQELERAKRAYEVMSASLRTASKGVEDTELRAPFAGVVARKLVRDFRNVQAKEPVLVLQDDSTLEIVVNVPERDWAMSRPDASPEDRAERGRPRVTVATFPDRSFPARLKEIATTADPTTRTYAVTLSFDKPTDANVLPGMTAKVTIDVPADVSGAGMALPTRAVLQNEGTEPYVWRVDPETMTVAKAIVSLGELSGDHIEIESGVEAGDQVAISGVHQLRDGMTVRRFE